MPTKWLQEHILQRKFSYDGDKLYEINFQNARCVEDTNLNKYINKKKSNGKVDMVMSTIDAKKLDLKVGEEKSYIVKVVGFKDKKMEDY